MAQPCLYSPLDARPEGLHDFWHKRFTGYFDFKYGSLICTCHNPRMKIPSPHIRMAICANCNKPYRHHLEQCIMCGSIGIKDFQHPGYCPHMPTCWDCTQEHCSDRVCSHIPEYLRHAGTVPPQTRSLKNVVPDEDMVFELDF